MACRRGEACLTPCITLSYMRFSTRGTAGMPVGLRACGEPHTKTQASPTHRATEQCHRPTHPPQVPPLQPCPARCISSLCLAWYLHVIAHLEVIDEPFGAPLPVANCRATANHAHLSIAHTGKRSGTQARQGLAQPHEE